MTSNQEIKENKNEADQSSETGAQAELLSKLRKRLGHDNDTQFAEALGIKKAFFSDYIHQLVQQYSVRQQLHQQVASLFYEICLYECGLSFLAYL